MKAEKILNAVQNLKHTALEMQDKLCGTLNIGLNAPAGFLRVGSLSEIMRREAAGVELRYENTDSGKIIQGLSQKTIDAGYIFGSSPVPDISLEKLHKSNLVVCAPNKWRDKITGGDWAAMAGFPWLYSEHYCPFLVITDRLFHQRGLTHIKVKAPQTNADDAKSELIGHGFGMALMEENEAHEALKKGKISILPTEPIHCDLNLAFLNDRVHEPLMKVCLKAVREAWGLIKTMTR